MVESLEVVPFTSPPFTCTRIRCSPLPTFSEPWNIMCSKRCAKPVWPGCSFRDPTSYVMQSDTVGAAWSSESTTRKPFFSVYCSMGICTSWAAAALARAGQLRGVAAIVTAAIPSVRASPAVERILKRFMLYSGQTYFRRTLYPTFNRRPSTAIVSSYDAKYAAELRYRIQCFSEVNSSVHGNHHWRECH